MVSQTYARQVDAGPDVSREAGGALAVELVTTYADLLALAPEYERMQRLSGNTLPFALHEWHCTWCRHFLCDDARVSAQPMIFVARDAAGSCAGIVPMIMTRRVIGPVECRTLDLLGPDPGITEIRIALVEPGRERDVAQAVLRRLAADRGWDWVQWSGLDGSFGQALAAAAELSWGAPTLDPVLDLPASWEQFRAGLKRNIRESLRHGYNSLKREGHAFELRVVEEPAAVAAALACFFDLHSARAQGSTGATHRDYFRSQPLREFLVDACVQLAQRNSVCIFQLWIGQAVVATRIGFVVGNSLYLYYSGFDPRWARFGVMTTTLAEAIKYSIGRGLSTVNLSPGSDPSKTRWGPRYVEFGSAVQVARSLKSRLAYALYRRARALDDLPGWLELRLARRKW
jgi:CelD/BcsL family acetyltransferase involved in cellulose biosynthesis